MIKAGQVYKEINAPKFRKPNKQPFLVTHVYFTSVSIIYSNGEVNHVGIDWIKGDCQLIENFDNLKDALQEFIK